MVIKKPWALALVASCAIFLAPVGQVLADEVVLDNGDRLTGTVVRVEGGRTITRGRTRITRLAGSERISDGRSSNSSLSRTAWWFIRT